MASMTKCLGSKKINAAKSSPPVIPVVDWTKEEVNAAESLLADAIWPTLSNIYDHVKDSDHKLIPKSYIVAEGRVLQLSLLMAKQQGHFDRLTDCVEVGQKGMEQTVYTDYLEDGHFESTYEKTAGDMVQSYWCRKHLSNMNDCFGNNRTQSAIARWLQLPRLVLRDDIAERVMWWADHPLADFQEQLTLYLPSKIVTLYMEVCTSYYVHFVKSDNAIQLCHYRNNLGLLWCGKDCKPSYGKFCSWTHSVDDRCRILADFDAASYGDDYIPLSKGDMVTIVHHIESGDGWSYAKNLKTMRLGWIPTDYAAPQ